MNIISSQVAQGLNKADIPDLKDEALHLVRVKNGPLVHAQPQQDNPHNGIY